MATTDFTTTRPSKQFVDIASRYPSFVERSPQGILYCQSWWLDAVAPGRFEIITVEEAGRIRAAWPLVWNAEHTLVHMPPLTQKLGILLEPLVGRYSEQLSEQHRLIKELIDRLPPNCQVNQKFHEAFTNWLPFYWKGFQQTTKYTYVIEDLTDLDAIWDAMRKRTRSTIRRARRSKLRIRETDDVEYFFQVYKKSFDRQGIETPYELGLVERIDIACRENAGRQILVAEDSSGRAHACDYLIYDSNCAISLLGGADANLRDSGAKAMLQWESIKFASTVSMRFDFEGSVIEPIEQYIRGFGGRQTPYYRIFGTTNNGDRGDRQRSRLHPRRVLGGVLRRLTNLIDPMK